MRFVGLFFAVSLSGCAHHYGAPVVVVAPDGDVAWLVEDDARVLRCVESDGTGPVCVRAEVRNHE